jgi:hypothetical protein
MYDICARCGHQEDDHNGFGHWARHLNSKETAMKHFACTLASPRQTVEVDAEDYIQAMHLGAAKIGTKRVSSVYVREIPEPTHTGLVGRA